MLFILGFLAILNLCVIAYQDFTSRAVTWIYFPTLAVIGICIHIYSCSDLKVVCRETFCNILFITFQFLLSFIYFIARNKFKMISLSSKIGLGDLLFLLASSFLFSPLQFVIFYTSSLFFSLIAYLTFFIIKKSNSSGTIPLAGLQSVYLSIWLLFFVSGFNYFLFDGFWLDKFLKYD